MLIGLDGSPESDAAVELGARWAGELGATLVGLGVIDEPAITLHGGAGYFKEQLDEALLHKAKVEVDRLLARFRARCAEAGVPCEVLEDVGQPCEQVLLEAQRYDLVLLGQETRFHFMTSDAPCETLTKVLWASPRPVVVVPRRLNHARNVLVAYDGSAQAARALAAFEATGLGRGGEVHVVSVNRDPAQAARHADRAVDFLSHHGIQAVAHAVGDSRAPAERLLEEARKLEVGLVVMGAYGQSHLRDFFLGSVTRSVLKGGDRPLFLTH
jgi:nucleotide-binding universal stress UspA family protein